MRTKPLKSTTTGIHAWMRDIFKASLEEELRIDKVNLNEFTEHMIWKSNFITSKISKLFLSMQLGLREEWIRGFPEGDRNEN